MEGAELMAWNDEGNNIVYQCYRYKGYWVEVLLKIYPEGQIAVLSFKYGEDLN